MKNIGTYPCNMHTPFPPPILLQKPSPSSSEQSHVETA
jgi:hypothetical protein